MTTPVTGGRVKCQWKADWALRWVALGVDYEMSGKDLIDSVTLSSKMCKAIGGTPPDGFNYELFLDEKGQKISKSKGNGLTIDQWLSYASPESLSLFMYPEAAGGEAALLRRDPARRRRILPVPRRLSRQQDLPTQLGNPVWHIHSGHPPAETIPVPFSMLLNLASASNTEDADILWGFITRHRPGVTQESSPALDRLVHYAVRYYHDFVKPHEALPRSRRDRARGARRRSTRRSRSCRRTPMPRRSRRAVYDVGRAFERYQTPPKTGRTSGPGVALTWFHTLYELLLGQERGPRFGSFVAIYGIAETRALIGKALAGELAQPPPLATAVD